MDHKRIALNHILHAIDVRIDYKINDKDDYLQGDDKEEVVRTMKAFRKEVAKHLKRVYFKFPGQKD